MKRLRSYGDDLASAGEKELDRTASFSSSSHHRRFYSKGPENGRSRPSPVIDDDRDREGSSRAVNFRMKRADQDFGDSSFDDREGGLRSITRKRLDHDLDGFDDREGSRGLRKRGDHDFVDNFDDRESSRGLRKRLEHDHDVFDRRKGFDRYRDRDGVVGSALVSPRSGYVGERDKERERERERDRDRERIHRAESFSVSRRDFPKGFRSERHWSRREDGGSSTWRRFDSRSKKEVDEDAKSSPVEKGGSSSSKGGRDSCVVSSSRDSLRSPQRIKDVKSPTWSRDSTRESKDSGGEPSKDTKKNESMMAESGGIGIGNGSRSEMEEGELQPESHQVPAPECPSVPEKDREDVAVCPEKAQVDMDTVNNSCEIKPCERAERGTDKSFPVRKLVDKDEKGVVDGGVGDDKELAVVEASNNEAVSATELSTPQSGPANEIAVSEEIQISALNDSEGAAPSDGSLKENQPNSSPPTNFVLGIQCKVEELDQTTVDKLPPEKERLMNNFDLEIGLDQSNEAIQEEIQKDPEPCVHVMKDKGKGVAICSPDEASLKETTLLIDRNFIACRDDAMEGPSTRGFELFSSSAGIKMECENRTVITKAETEKLKLEPLDLSLGLPNVSVPVTSNSTAAPPSSPPRARSVQSFATTLLTGSDCFTTSISFSGSQFIHNPSCSLTHNSVDYDFEQSVKSRPLFQGIDWQALSANDSMQKEMPTNQKLLSNGDGSLQLSHGSQGMLNGRTMHGQQGTPSCLDISSSFQRQLAGKARYQDDHRSPAQSVGSRDTRSEYGKDKKRAMGEESVSRLFRSSSQREMEQGLASERDLVDRMIYLIVSEPIQAIAWRVHEMPERSVASLKEGTCEIIVKEDNREKLRALQEILRKRSDLNLETLLKSHRSQLQILVAVKTGLPGFIQRADSFSSSDFAEIFLNLKCRNSNCQSALPVDECDCRFCSQKDGFCSSCMCLVCSKFDTASNTCGWVGCDVCNHWCHTDCGLLKSYIINGRSANGAQGVSEMQFYCLACEHPSEMFGFVKDVFKTCASEWKGETLVKELEYVKRIFSASNDTRGKLLHDVAKQLLAGLQTGTSSTEVYNQIMAFLNEGVSKLGNSLGSSGRELQLQPLEKSRGDIVEGIAAAALRQEAIWSNPISAKEKLPRVENVRVSLPSIDGNSASGGSWATEMAPSMSKKPVMDELDSIIRAKQAEAELFQKRADDARREAEGLQRIAIAKNEKIEEEYATRIAKLCLPEAEERRKKKVEELQSLERSHREYFNMKTRMEADIKNLLLKMEAAGRNLST